MIPYVKSDTKLRSQEAKAFFIHQCICVPRTVSQQAMHE